MIATPMIERLTFEQRQEECVMWIEKRRHKWTLHSTSYDDIKQRMLIRIWKQYHKFDPTKKDKHGKPVEFRKWVNKLISNEWKNALRDLHYKWSRPCIQGKGGCPFAAGTDGCSKTPSGKQCDECLIFKDWRLRKESHFAINQTLTLENHSQEVHSIQSDTVDIESAKKVIDVQMKKRLSPAEYRVSHLLYVLNKTPEQVGKVLGYRKRPGSRMWAGYQQVQKLTKHIIATAKTVIEEQGLA